MPVVTVTGDVIERVTATRPASAPLSAKISVRIAAGLMPHSWAPSSSWITERTALPSVAKRKKATSAAPAARAIADASSWPVRMLTPRIVDRVAADAQAQRLDRIAPHEQALDDEGHAEHQQQAEQHAPFAALAVHRLHQREVEERARRRRRRRSRRARPRPPQRPASIEQGDDDRPEHGDLSLGEVEHSAEAVDEGQADAEQAELQPEDDPVEDHRPHRSTRSVARVV